MHQPEPIIASLFRLGFDDVFEVARAAEIVSHAIAQALEKEERERPLISSACPAIVRLIQVNYPSLLDNVVDFISPMEAAAKIASRPCRIMPYDLTLNESYEKLAAEAAK